jgi:hypothetical protein
MATAYQDVLRVTAKLTGADSQAIQNVYQIRFLGLLGASDATTVTDVCDEMEVVYATIKALNPTSTKYVSIEIFNETQNYSLGEHPWPTFVQGNAAVDPSTPGSAYLIQLLTGFVKTYGRKFFGEMAVSYLTGGNVTAGGVTGLVAVGALLIATWVGSTSGANYEFGVVDKTSAFRRFVEAVVRDVPAYQRRRRQGRGI